MIPTFTTKERKQSLKEVAKNQKRLKKWAQHAPMNNRHKWLLVEAELARIEGRDLDAMKFFKEAVRFAGENEFLQEQALANELAARFWMGRGDNEIAGFHMNEAHYCYAGWGAKAKVRHLERTYPQLLAEVTKRAPGEKRERQTVGVSVSSADELAGGALDLASVIKTSQAISGEVDLEALLKKAMLILIQSAGAQEGCLIMKKDGELIVRAHITAGMDSAILLEKLTAECGDLLSQAIVQYVVRTQEAVVLSNAAVEGMFSRDPYIVRKKPLSILCMPVMQHGVVVGVLYLENNQVTDAFTQDRMEVLRILSSQAAISIQNALLYSERKQTEDALRESELKYRTILEEMEDCYLESDLKGLVTFANPFACIALGYSRDEIIGMHFAQFTAPDAVEKAKLNYDSILDAGITGKPFSWKILKKNGENGFFETVVSLVRDKTGEPIGFRGVGRDITERRKAEKELREAEEKYRNIFDNSAEGIYQTTPDGRVLTANPAAARILGYDSPEEAIASVKNLAKDLYVDSSRREEFRALMQTQGHVRDFELRAYKKDRSVIDLSLNCHAFLDNSGNIRYFEGAIEDITEKKRTEELKIAKEAAEAANVAKSEFLANMSHEIRTPINGIIGMTGLLLDTGLSGEQRNYAEMLRSSGDLLLGLINDILDFSKIEAGKLEIETIEFDLRATLEETAEFLSLRAHEKGLELVCRIGPGVPPFLRGDPGRLRQILVNLIGNAIKFTSAGEVVIEAVTEYETGGQVGVRFNIRDTGIGIPEDKTSLLFNSFQQVDASTSRKFGGTGLGLAISRRLVELMNGRIGVQSIEGQGSDFWFTAVFDKGSPPDSLHREARQAAIITSHRLGETAGRNVRILLVDDIKVNQTVALGILGRLGFSADTADNGQQAIDMLEAVSYDIVFMDVQMPVMDGYQTTRAIRGGKTKAANPDVPIIAMTAHAMKGDREKCLQEGMDDYISKPISPQELSKTLERWLPQEQAELPQTKDMPRGKTAAAEALPVFDYEGLMGRIMDDMELAGKIVAAFMEEIPRMVDELREQIVGGDAGLAGRQAHKIKGAASNTGFMAISAIAADMQQAGEKRQMETIIALMPELDSQLELLKTKIKDSGVLGSANE